MAIIATIETIINITVKANAIALAKSRVIIIAGVCNANPVRNLVSWTTDLTNSSIFAALLAIITAKDAVCEIESKRAGLYIFVVF